MVYKVKILKVENVVRNVKGFVVEKPKGYEFVPGQATLVAIDKPKWRNKQRSFTFTSLNSDNFLEFVIKIYRGHRGVTNMLGELREGDFLLIREPFGSISYKGKGVFIAGGAGITPFVAIFRQLLKDGGLMGNKLIFSNKTSEDVILERELKEMLEGNEEDLILTLTEERNEDYLNRRIDNSFLMKYVKDFSQYFYICGPELFVISIKEILKKIGVEENKIVVERDF